MEIETYTWDVLPAQFKTGDIVEYLERELNWVRDQLGEPGVMATHAPGPR